MIIIGEDVMEKIVQSGSPEALVPFKYPRFYEPSNDTKIFILVLSIALLFAPFLSGDKYLRIFFFAFAILVNLFYMAYAFGHRVTLYADKIEYQSAFFFKRLVRREQIVSWQLQLTETRAPVFLLLLKSGRKDVKDLVIEINFKMDPAFYAWFPKLETLVQDRCLQFPPLKDIAG